MNYFLGVALFGMPFIAKHRAGLFQMSTVITFAFLPYTSPGELTISRDFLWTHFSLC